MERYNVIKNKNKREIVLLKSRPCFWGKCSFCDYIDDNCLNEDEMNKINFQVLNNITGEYQSLEVINSASCFDLPTKTLQEIKRILELKNMNKLFLESHWIYRKRLHEMKDFFNTPIIFKVGIETFDNDFRNGYLNKNAIFNDYKDVKEYFQSVCIMVGIKGQTKDMVKKDIDILLNHFDYGTINIFTENTTPLKRDGELIQWFKKEYKFLDDIEKIEVLYENTDFGVGD
ncbi:radical SAM protein [Clostridium bovifaecis]|uniref:Radical SAM protein n=1 Tax=Clostridium bovifaecis TaxID=2184719 RepID=A0A6I6F734_9CLOT|nr:radical SAM protein [Clostridium bovifaecis]